MNTVLEYQCGFCDAKHDIFHEFGYGDTLSIKGVPEGWTFISPSTTVCPAHTITVSGMTSKPIPMYVEVIVKHRYAAKGM